MDTIMLKLQRYERGVKMAEHEEQVALFNWAAYNVRKYPCLEYMFAIPNGGHRHISVAKKLKAEGVKAGVLDIMLPFASKRYHGLFIEMKFGRNKTTDQQNKYINHLTENKYCVAVCYNWEDAADVIKLYLSNGVIS